MLDEEALKRIRQTLPENIRDKVKLGKNGLIDRKSLNKIKSDDSELQRPEGDGKFFQNGGSRDCIRGTMHRTVRI